MSTSSGGEVKYLLHHAVLPPKLPQEDDFDASHEQMLLVTAMDTLKRLRKVASKGKDQLEAAKQFESAELSLSNILRCLTNDGYIDQAELQKLFLGLATNTSSGTVPLEIKRQNAGVIARKDGSDIVFEVFELSPMNDAVMKTKGRLVRSFPASACRIPLICFLEEGFIVELSHTISTMSLEEIEEVQPKSWKAGGKHNEIRDTKHPRMVTDYLVSVLRATGRSTDTPVIRKNTREEVLWRNVLHPWRRSPMWLLIRVVMQLHFTRAAGTSHSVFNMYKLVMVNIFSDILKMAAEHINVIGADSLFATSAKLTRRFRKLKLTLPESYHLYVTEAQESLASADRLLQEGWSTIISASSSKLDSHLVEALQPAKDTYIELPDLEEWIYEITGRGKVVRNSLFKPTMPYPTFAKENLPKLSTVTGQCKYFQLMALENWVESHLSIWLDRYLDDESTCGRLGDLIKTYYGLAIELYSNIPGSLSLMYLTIAELWVACDRCICHLESLHQDFDSEVDFDPLFSLSLPLQSQLERLTKVRIYVQSRRNIAKQRAPRAPSLFRQFGHRSSFAVRYFDQSPSLQSLRSRIENDATNQRRRKREELENKKAEYRRLIETANAMSCDRYTVTCGRYGQNTRLKHSNSCEKCALRGIADGIKIQVHEWPLSDDNNTAKATCFELQIPNAFSKWRDTTLFLKMDVLGFKIGPDFESPCNDLYALRNDPGLSQFLSAPSQPRLSVHSETKPVITSHYGEQKITTELMDSQVCVNKGMYFRYYIKDTYRSGTLLPTDHVLEKCIYQLPARSSQLQRYLKASAYSDTITPNSVIASLSDCPPHMSILEYKAFGALFIGHNIQYTNLLTQLAMPNIDFKKPETQCLVRQLLHQAGPVSEVEPIKWVSHLILANVTFCRSLVCELEVALKRVSENWECWRALEAFLQTALRVLSLTSSSETQSQCLEFLAKIRGISLDWLQKLKSRARNAIDVNQRDELYSRASEISLLCINTFNADDKFLHDILSSPDVICALFQCSFVIQENEGTASSDHMYLFRAMVQSWMSVLFRAHLILRKDTFSGALQQGLSQAVADSWAGFRPAGHWCFLDSPYHHWAYVKSGSLDVHVNLLTAELLVEGLPLSRLPTEYLEHPMYTALLSRTMMEVMPTDEPGMTFSSKHVYQDHQLSFRMQGSDMFLVATGDSGKFDLVPPRLFQTKLPVTFAENFFHWYNHDSQEIEFRPQEDPWSSRTNNWRLKKVKSSWHLENGHSCLIDPRSHTGRTLTQILSSLDRPSHLNITLDKTSSAISIELPRLHLDFEVNHGVPYVHSRQYRGMIIDPDQSMGALVGLSNKLVLKHVEELEDRVVLIPEGTVSYFKKEGHIFLAIDPDTTRKVYAYQLDETLNRIVDNRVLQSKILLAYLHALTSYCLPDTLTRQTGTEAALSILRSAGTLSFEFLSEENIELLRLIGKLTPARNFYPEHLTVMQQIEWNRHLSPLSQHPDFFTQVKHILSIAEGKKFLYPEKIYVDPLARYPLNIDLNDRDKIRTSTFRVDAFGAEHYNLQLDVVYTTRSGVGDGERGVQAATAAKLILRDNEALHSKITARELEKSLRDAFGGGSGVKGPENTLEPADLRFDPKWLREPSDFLPSLWCDLHTALSTRRHCFNKFVMMTWLSSVAFAKSADFDLIEALAALYFVPRLWRVTIPQCPSFNLTMGVRPTIGVIRSIVNGKLKSFWSCPESHLSRNENEPENEWHDRQEARFDSNSAKAAEDFASNLESQWRRENPILPNTEGANTYIDTRDVMSAISPMFKACFNNRLFFDYLSTVANEVSNGDVDAISIDRIPQLKVPMRPTEPEGNGAFRIDDIFELEAPLISSRSRGAWQWPETPKELTLRLEQHTVSGQNRSARDCLVDLCRGLENQATTAYEKKYVADLLDSCNSLSDQTSSARLSVDIPEDELTASVQQYAADWERYFTGLNLLLNSVIKSSGDIAGDTIHCPRLCPTFWLSRLNKEHFDTLSEHWKKTVIEYGLAVTQLHRSHRLRAHINNSRVFTQELNNRGHQNWDPAEFPETLLLEAESGIIVREIQEEIAQNMRDPPQGQNSTMQLNIGEGKSSVIVPIVADALADGKRLVRVIVAKPQSKQMFQMLVTKLGGLLNRRIYHMPFSRTLKLGTREAESIRQTFNECMKNRGILLVQPEHILSFKLMGIEHIISENVGLGQSLLGTQQFFDSYSRDIVDESDENFSVKFELVYTMGTQRPIKLCPERWNIIHAMLELVSHFAAKVKARIPSSIEYDNRWEGTGRYPRIRILRSDAEDMLLNMIASHICTVGFRYLQIARQPESVQRAVLKYIRHPDLTAEDIQAVENGTFGSEAFKDTLLLIRGLIAGGVLRFTFRLKRWRVHYGLDANRSPATQLAVPYRSKDNPSARSEFSHPDVVLVLTSLTYYYGGLEDDDLFHAFDHLLQTDQADIEYGYWVLTAKKLPEALHSLTGVNIKDRRECLTKIFPYLCFSKGAIDYYLSNVVFPKEMKEFPYKLSASGWDIGAIKEQPTTGFSGTNDSRHVLLLSVHHLDLPNQTHTNALVLSYLLQDESSVKLVLPQAAAKMSDAEQLLMIVNEMNTPTRVILDVGAQILELNNYQVAETWLGMSDPDTTKAVVYFNDDEEICVLDRSGRAELLQTSAYAKNMDACLVYLDEAHTRGTDLKLPESYRAAVTLGANLTKDRLVQACMRMRQLGKGQSVVFCIPEEIQRKILECTWKKAAEQIAVSDVLVWAISETWADLRRSMPLWATQGRRFEKHKDLLDGVNTTTKNAEKFLEQEARSIEDRYRPHSDSWPSAGLPENWDISNANIGQILRRCQEFEIVKFDSATLEEEQERELSPEIEEERQLERPRSMDPEQHKLHPDLQYFMEKGVIKKSSSAFIPAFNALDWTSAAKHHGIPKMAGTLFVTNDFIQTIEKPKGLSSSSFVVDSYLRPVQWILSAKDAYLSARSLVVISLFEANYLLPILRDTRMRATLHLYAPRLNLVYLPLDHLALYCVGAPYSPSEDIISQSDILQLNLFAGQQYFDSYEEYIKLCKHLGLAWGTAKEGQEVFADGFVLPHCGEWGLKKSPVQFLHELLKIRREGEGMEKTHMGRVLNGELLEKRDFE